MKKLIYFFLVFGLFACSDDDSQNLNGLELEQIVSEFESTTFFF